jgi:TM2 domain-containing membrane protein YozV
MNKNNKISAGLLALFIGTLGIHWFYLNETSKGVTYLLLTILGWLTFGLFFGAIIILVISILCLIDGISFLTMSDKDFNKKYNK